MKMKGSPRKIPVLRLTKQWVQVRMGKQRVPEGCPQESHEDRMPDCIYGGLEISQTTDKSMIDTNKADINQDKLNIRQERKCKHVSCKTQCEQKFNLSIQ